MKSIENSNLIINPDANGEAEYRQEIIFFARKCFKEELIKRRSTEQEYIDLNGRVLYDKKIEEIMAKLESLRDDAIKYVEFKLFNQGQIIDDFLKNESPKKFNELLLEGIKYCYLYGKRADNFVQLMHRVKRVKELSPTKKKKTSKEFEQKDGNSSGIIIDEKMRSAGEKYEDYGINTE
jgi:hypothetical protein